MAHKFKKGGWKPVHPSQRGSETRRAKKAGRSLHAQAEIDSHSPDKRIRGKGIFALNAQAHKFGKKVGKKRAKAKGKGKKAVRRKRVARKKA